MNNTAHLITKISEMQQTIDFLTAELNRLSFFIGNHNPVAVKHVDIAIVDSASLCKGEYYVAISTYPKGYEVAFSSEYMHKCIQYAEKLTIPYSKDSLR